MTARTINDGQEDAFLEDATNGWLDAADQHNIPHSLAEVLLLDEILRDFHMADHMALQSYLSATMAALYMGTHGGEDQPGYQVAIEAREMFGPELVAAMDKLIADSVTETTVITGARLQ